jgi:hypothetical protein
MRMIAWVLGAGMASGNLVVAHHFCLPKPREWRALPGFPRERSPSLVSFYGVTDKVMGVVVLKCRKCNLMVAPEDLVIILDGFPPESVEKGEITWHARCAPRIVREHIPPTKGGITLSKKQQLQ